MIVATISRCRMTGPPKHGKQIDDRYYHHLSGEAKKRAWQEVCVSIEEKRASLDQVSGSATLGINATARRPIGKS